MSWVAVIAAVAGLTTGIVVTDANLTTGIVVTDDNPTTGIVVTDDNPTTGIDMTDADSVSGRCRDGRVWTTSTVEQSQMLGLINLVRADAKRPPLTRQPVLDKMAVAHAADMACRDYFDHRNPERQRLQDRLQGVDDGSLADWQRLGEVIGTSVTPRRQVDKWLDSRAHRRAVLDEGYDCVGVGLVRIAGSRYGTYWAVELAAHGR